MLILNFDDGGDNILANAKVVQDAVRYISSVKPSGSDSLRLAGISMGGVIARYALAEAEESASALNVSHFLSLDAPHQGAVIDAEFQDWVTEKTYLASLQTTAARQMLVYNAYNSDGSEHKAFYETLTATNGSGYPKHTRNIAVAFSTSSPNGLGQWLEIVRRFGVIDLSPVRFYIEHDNDTAELGSYLPLSSTTYWGLNVWKGV